MGVFWQIERQQRASLSVSDGAFIGRRMGG